MSSSRIARARVVQGESAEGAAALAWPAIGESILALNLPPAPVRASPDSPRAPDRRESGEAAPAGIEADDQIDSHADCREQMQSVRREMEAAVDHARLIGHGEGLRQGEQRGRQAAAAELEPVMARLLQTIEALSATRDAFRREAEEDVVRLSLGIARRVVHREVTIDGTVLVGVIRAALDKIGARELHRVLVSPADQPAIAAGLEAMRLGRRVDVVADANLERGAVLFETVKGTLDASLETQLDEIERGLIDALDRRPA